jgi:putative transcription factor
MDERSLMISREEGISMYCSVCGSKTEELFLVEIEGSILEVCERCSSSGRVVKKVEKPVQQSISKEPESEIVREIVPNYAEIIRRVHQQTGLKSEDFAKKINERESILKKMESGKMQPSFKVAEKLERMFSIRLIQEVKSQPGDKKYSDHKDTGAATLGDIVRFRKS